MLIPPPIFEPAELLPLRMLSPPTRQAPEPLLERLTSNTLAVGAPTIVQSKQRNHFFSLRNQGREAMVGREFTTRGSVAKD